MKFFTYWTLAVALSISAVAAYYSIVGLAAIFAAALIPIIIMGSVLEVAKITTAVWLHINWKESNKLIRSYLTIATVVLMLITSMGIFGFLSKAHIEQIAIGGEYQAQIEQMQSEISYEESRIERNTGEIASLQDNTPNRIARIQDQINTEQGRIDQIMQRIQPVIAEQELIISSAQERLQQRIQPINDTIDQNRTEIQQLTEERSNLNSSSNDSISNINDRLSQLRIQLTRLTDQSTLAGTLYNSRDRQSITQLQSIINIDINNRDGILGPTTTQRYNEYIASINSEIATTQQQIDDLQTQSSTQQAQFNEQRNTRLAQIDSRIQELNQIITDSRNQIETLLSTPDEQTNIARQRITEIRTGSQPQIDSINETIVELRQQLSTITDDTDMERITQLETDIQTSRDTISGLTSQIFSIQSQIRSLEAEVGPVKYISQMIYGENNDINTLEKSVRIVILMLVFVFDPLAIVLVIAGISTIEKHNNDIKKIFNETTDETSDTKNDNSAEVEILENPIFVPDDKSSEKKPRKSRKKQKITETQSSLSDVENTEKQINMVIKTK